MKNRNPEKETLYLIWALLGRCIALEKNLHLASDSNLCMRLSVQSHWCNLGWGDQYNCLRCWLGRQGHEKNWLSLAALWLQPWFLWQCRGNWKILLPLCPGYLATLLLCCIILYITAFREAKDFGFWKEIIWKGFHESWGLHTRPKPLLEITAVSTIPLLTN